MLGNVKRCEDNTVYKNNIITELFNSGLIQEKISGMCYRNFISRDTYIQEDILQEVFFHVSKVPVETVIEMYEDNPSRLIGLSVRIIAWKGLSGLNNTKLQPKHSVAKHILFASNLNRAMPLSLNGNENKQEYLFIEKNCLGDDADIWATFESELNEEDLAFLETFIFNKAKGRNRKEVKKKYECIVDKIKAIAKNRNLKIKF